jgi:hypothetical protein
MFFVAVQTGLGAHPASNIIGYLIIPVGIAAEVWS